MQTIHRLYIVSKLCNIPSHKGNWAAWLLFPSWIVSTKSSDFKWWRHQMETFSALLVICAGIHRSVTRSFNIFFDLHLNKRLSKQWWGWWFETTSRPLWCHSNDSMTLTHPKIDLNLMNEQHRKILNGINIGSRNFFKLSSLCVNRKK